VASPQVERGDVVRTEILGEDLVELSVRLPRLAHTAKPGQFAQLRCGDGVIPLLRRPFSVAWVSDDICSFVIAPIGEGTRRLCNLRTGELLDIIGPLGHGFTVSGSVQHAVCVSGGVGCAPFPLLVRDLRARGCDVTVLSGAASERRLYPADRYQRGDVEVQVIEATDDGSRGERGYVTQLLASTKLDNAVVYACGPNVMLAAVAKQLSASGAQLGIAEASLEAPMGCGFGTCLGCVVPVLGEHEWALCCSDGPAVAMDHVDWDALMALPDASVA
jgi:dihydroorotate dehydrogenase electron transfer subunit